MKLFYFSIMMLYATDIAWAENIDEQCLALGYTAPLPKPTPEPTPLLTPVPLPSPSPSASNPQGNDDSCNGLILKRWSQDQNGWTIFPTAAKNIFVSASGVVPAGAPENSVGAKSMAAGAALLEKGKHQALLLKRGETFDGVSLDSHLSGPDADHLMVIGAYGSGPRPKLVFKGPVGLVAANAGANVAIVDLDLEGSQSTGDGIRSVQNSGQNLLIEGVRIAGFQNGIATDFQSPDEKPAFTNLVIRRSVVIDNYAKPPAPGKDVGHSQGLYLAKVKGLLIEESFFDHNGWKNNGKGDEDRKQGGSGAPTIFNHNLYIQTEGQCYTYRKNVSVRGSATGLQMRAGGVVEDSLFAFNPAQLTYGSVNGGSVDLKHILPGVSGRVRNNVLVWGNDISPSLQRNGYTEVGNILHAVVEGNIFAHHVRGPLPGFGVNLRGRMNGIGIHNLLFKDNVIYDMNIKLQFEGDGWGSVDLKAEEGGAAVYKNGKRITTAKDSGIPTKFAPRSIADAGSVLSGNVLQVGPNDFMNLQTPPKSGIQMQNMQKAPVQFVDPSRKIDDTYIQKIRNLERANWDSNLLAPQMNSWIREGFQKKN